VRPPVAARLPFTPSTLVSCSSRRAPRPKSPASGDRHSRRSSDKPDSGSAPLRRYASRETGAGLPPSYAFTRTSWSPCTVARIPTVGPDVSSGPAAVEQWERPAAGPDATSRSLRHRGDPARSSMSVKASRAHLWGTVPRALRAGDLLVGASTLDTVAVPAAGDNADREGSGF
jgi:hypothetical protein